MAILIRSITDGTYTAVQVNVDDGNGDQTGYQTLPMGSFQLKPNEARTHVRFLGNNNYKQLTASRPVSDYLNADAGNTPFTVDTLETYLLGKGFFNRAPAAGGGGANVTSWNTRTGDVLPENGDYNYTEISNFQTGVSANTDVTANTAKVSADGSVTTHNDVSSAGSGQIITSGERTDINASVGVHSDVDLTTNAPVANDFFIFDGTNFIPFKFDTGLASSADFSRPGQTTEGLINQTQIFETYLVLNFTPLYSGEYVLSADYTRSYNAATSSFESQVILENLTVPSTEQLTIDYFEPKDVGGTGVLLDTLVGGVIGAQVNSGTTERLGYSTSKTRTLTAGNNYQLRIEWTGDALNAEAAIYQAELRFDYKI